MHPLVTLLSYRWRTSYPTHMLLCLVPSRWRLAEMLKFCVVGMLRNKIIQIINLFILKISDKDKKNAHNFFNEDFLYFYKEFCFFFPLAFCRLNSYYRICFSCWFFKLLLCLKITYALSLGFPLFFISIIVFCLYKFSTVLVPTS